MNSAASRSGSAADFFGLFFGMMAFMKSQSLEGGAPRPPGKLPDLTQAIDLHHHARVRDLVAQFHFPKRLLGTAFLHAVMGSADIEILVTLLRAGAPPEIDRGMAMMAYASMGSLDGLEMLAEAGMPVSNAYQAATIAAASGDVNLLRFFIEGGVAPDADGGEILRRACANGHLEAVRYLIDSGATASANSGGMVLAAVQSGNASLVTFLVDECHVSLDEISREALAEACLHDDDRATPMIEFLLSRGVSPQDMPRAQAVSDRMRIKGDVTSGPVIKSRVSRGAGC